MKCNLRSLRSPPNNQIYAAHSLPFLLANPPWKKKSTAVWAEALTFRRMLSQQHSQSPWTSFSCFLSCRQLPFPMRFSPLSPPGSQALTRCRSHSLARFLDQMCGGLAGKSPFQLGFAGCFVALWNPPQACVAVRDNHGEAKRNATHSLVRSLL
jgi:hypothetical protein